MSPGTGEATAVRWGIAGASILALLMVTGPTLSARTLADARDTAARGDLATALTDAREAADLAPQDPAPRLLEANILSDLGRAEAADAAFAAAAARSPRDWEVFADWAAALAGRGDDRGARVAAMRAHRLNPREPRPLYILESLRG
jgi:Flp pilus assembly protein TadD